MSADRADREDRRRRRGIVARAEPARRSRARARRPCHELHAARRRRTGRVGRPGGTGGPGPAGVCDRARRRRRVGVAASRRKPLRAGRPHRHAAGRRRTAAACRRGDDRALRAVLPRRGARPARWAARSPSATSRSRSTGASRRPEATRAGSAATRTSFTRTVCAPCATAILIGARTLRTDRPSLTVRHTEGDDPVRVVLGDADDVCCLEQAAPGAILVIGCRDGTGRASSDQVEHVVLPSTDGRISTRAILEALYRNDILSVYIEGGAITTSSVPCRAQHRRAAAPHLADDHRPRGQRVRLPVNRVRRRVGALRPARLPLDRRRDACSSAESRS